MAITYDSFVVALDRSQKVARNGAEYWQGREIQGLLGYSNWQNFEAVIQRARMAADASGMAADKHFIEVSNMIEAGRGAKVPRADWILSRYATFFGQEGWRDRSRFTALRRLCALLMVSVTIQPHRRHFAAMSVSIGPD